jgi:hypothetical protein
MSSHAAAFGWMQARLIELLLRHDERSFHRVVAARPAQGYETASGLLQRYRELGALFHLRDDLFEHILPRLVRRLSFETPRALVIAESPPYGRVDWERTLEKAWTTHATETPLSFYTRQQRRDFATPENLLTVVTLLEYQAAVQRLLRSERIATGAYALRHPLNESIDRCERELAFPQFAGLRPAAHSIIHEGDTERLEAQVHERCMSGGNSAYADLLNWRHRWRGLPLLQPGGMPDDGEALGADPAHLDALYQSWLWYELVDMLHAQSHLEHVDTTPDQMRLIFRWGSGPDLCRYELCYNQPVPDAVRHHEPDSVSHYLYSIDPTFYLRRITPPPERVEQHGRCFWREPGIIWEACYAYGPQDDASSLYRNAPLRALIANLALSGEGCGFLVGACHLLDREKTTADTLPDACVVPRDKSDQAVQPDQQIVTWQVSPASCATAPVRQALTMLLEDAHNRLRQPRVPRCQGVFLDTLSAAEQAPLIDRYNQTLDDDVSNLLLCPKAHIGPGRVDLVSRKRHCCQDARLCHIVGRPDAQKPLRPPRTAEELLTELKHMFAHTDDEDVSDATIQAISQQVEALTRRFAEIMGIYRRIEVYHHRLRDLGMERTLDLLGAAECESLALSVFLVEQLDSVESSDYSAAVIHIASVVELELQRRVERCPGLTGAAFPHGRPTLGTLPFMRRNPERTGGDWERLVDYLATHWHGHVDPDNPDDEITFEAFVRVLNEIKMLRNRAAHTQPIPRAGYVKLFRLACQAGPLRIGALNVLLLAWRL